MTPPFSRLPLLVAVPLALPALAQSVFSPADEPPPPPATVAKSDAAPPRVGSVLVTGSRDAAAATPAAVDARSLQFLRAATSDTASLLRALPGVSLYGAGGISSLPSIRGLADDRIRIKVDGMDLIAACPNHMNPPLAYLDPSNVGTLEVHAGVAPVSLGGDSIAGTIVAESSPPLFAGPGEGTLAKGEVGAHYRSNGDGFGATIAATLAGESLSLSYAGSTAERDNERAGGDFKASTTTGRAGHALARDEIGSSAFRTRNHELAIAYTDGGQLLEARVGRQDIPYQLWPNQRMDMLDNVQERVNVRWRGRFAWGRLDARAWHERVDHFMDFGPDKRYWYAAASGGPSAPDGVPCEPAGPTCAAGMPMFTASTNTGATVKGAIDLSDRDVLRAGGELQRYRLDDWWPASGGGMWPDTFWNIRDGRRDRAALYAEWEGKPAPQWTVLTGVRYERVASDTGPVQAYNDAAAPATGRVAAFNGRDRARTDHNVDATLVARYRPHEALDVEVGLARKVRSPSLYERYTWMTRGMEMLMVNWFGDGNGYVGDPDLVAEKAHTVSVTVDWHAPDGRWRLAATPYYTRVTDYVDAVRCPPDLGGACATQTPGGGKFVFLQFANQSARLYGLDLAAQASVDVPGIGELGVTGVVGYTDGRNRSTGDNLYNIMPPNARVVLTHRRRAWDSALELIAVSAKDDVSSTRNEVATGGHGLVNLRVAYQWNRLRIDAGVENVFDRLYAPPLGGAYLGQGTTMTASPVGSVPRWGTPVPGAGRSFYVGAKVAF